MLFTSDQLVALWAEIRRERAAGLEKGLVVLHSIADVDSCCAAKLFMVRRRREGGRRRSGARCGCGESRARGAEGKGAPPAATTTTRRRNTRKHQRRHHSPTNNTQHTNGQTALPRPDAHQELVLPGQRPQRPNAHRARGAGGVERGAHRRDAQLRRDGARQDALGGRRGGSDGGGGRGGGRGGNRAEGRGCEAGAVGAEGRPPRPRRAHNTRAHATPTTTTTHHHTATPPYKHNHH